MAYDCRVYRILIASPNDVDEERDAAVQVIQEWNNLHSYNRNTVLLPLRWETHVSPELGARPQEIINKEIVDACDLLVGIFWTRIGTPTGRAEGGTLEEIERVAKAGKPVMLYFSRCVIDPEIIDWQQHEKLKEFKKNISGDGIIETFKTHTAFRDAFARHLEAKVRELQISDRPGHMPLSLELMGADRSNRLGTLEYKVERLAVSYPDDAEALLYDTVKTELDRRSTVPIAVVIRNSSASGIRNVYIRIRILSSSSRTQFSQHLAGDDNWSVLFSNTIGSSPFMPYQTKTKLPPPRIVGEIRERLREFEVIDVLHKVGDHWELSFEWEAIQPQRARPVKQIIYACVEESTKLSLEVDIYADSFPEPQVLKADIKIDVVSRDVTLEELIPNWSTLLHEIGNARAKVITPNLDD